MQKFPSGRRAAELGARLADPISPEGATPGASTTQVPITARYRLLLSVLAVGIASATVLFGSYAAWTDQTTNPGNTVSAGTLTMDNDKDGLAVITAGPVVPGASGSDTVTIDNVGDVPFQVFLTQSGLNGTAVEGSLGLSIHDDTYDYCYWDSDGANAGACNGYGAWDATGTVNNLQLEHAAGNNFWPVGSPHTFTLAWELDSSSVDAEQGQDGTFDLTWDATE